MTKEHYMALADLQAIWDDSMKPFIQESIGASVVAGLDVYVGTGTSYNDVMIAANHHEFVRKGSLVPIAANNAYIWVILPNVYSPVVQLSGMIVPMTEQSSVTLNNVTYKVLRSDSQYAGNFSISLI